MDEDKTRRAEPTSSNIEEILRQRERLEQILREKYKKEVTILFTDICGYTEYIDSRGDINGRALLMKHNSIVLPIIESHQGRVIEIVGDAVMATFAAPLPAVKASIAIQKALAEYNRNTKEIDAIRVKIGINLGEALVDEAAVYQGFTGDVANVASRVQAQASPNQILISKNVYDQIYDCEDILCRFHGAMQVKGKSVPLKIYRVVWGDEGALLSEQPQFPVYEHPMEKRARKPVRVFQLDINREKDRLKISAREYTMGDEDTIRHYEDMRVSMEWIETRCHEMVETLNKVNRRGRIDREVLIKLKEVGQVLYDELFPLSVKEKLGKTTVEYLSLTIDDQLVQIPWELLNDGQQFLCQRFNMGRLVKTRQPISVIKSRPLAAPLRMLILADPEGNLKGAYTEGIQIRDFMDRDEDLLNVSFRSGNITLDSIKEKIRNFDFVHFAGHAEYDSHNPAESGWRLTEGSLLARDIGKMAGTGNMPALIFANACQSARTGEWTLREQFQGEIFGLANGFLLTGVRHYVGTFWEVLDEPSSHFSLEFYKSLLSDKAIGEAIRLARLELIKKYGEENIVWASYILYGDPTFNYIDQIEGAEVRVESKSAYERLQRPEVRAREEVIDFADQKVPKKRRIWMALVAGIIASLVIALWGYPLLSNKQIAHYEKVALTHYQNGNFEKALDACAKLKAKRPDASLIYLIQGNIHFRKGNLDKAEAAYRNVLQATEGTNSQKAEALMSLGRIASLRRQYSDALNYYQKATELAPQNRTGYLSQALILEDRGNYGEAFDLLKKARELAPDDRLLSALINDVQKKVAFTQDKEKQERIDQMVKELLKSMKSPPWALPWDGWTSLPLTVWVMDFEMRGYSLREAEDHLLVSGIVDHLLEYDRIQVVERELLDKLLKELELGSSKLIDRNTALAVGKLVAARLILSGQLVYSEPLTQISMRLIETESGRITAAVNESFGSAVPPSDVAATLSEKLLEKLKQLYPLRGKISKVNGENIELNIGKVLGVRAGQRFKIIEGDITLVVTSTNQGTSLSKIAKGEGPVVEGQRVEGI